MSGTGVKPFDNPSRCVKIVKVKIERNEVPDKVALSVQFLVLRKTGMILNE